MRLRTAFPSTKIPRPLPPKCRKSGEAAAAASTSGLPRAAEAGEKAGSTWSVYLIASSRLSKTYVGVTTDFPRRLRQHNGEIKGGAKAASAGRPWNLACLVEGFMDRSEACEFESKWKNISRKMPRKKKEPGINSALQHREAALSRAKTFFDCSHIRIKWHSD